MVRVGWVTMQSDSGFLLHITLNRKSVDFTNWYKYELHISIQTPTLMMETEEICVALVFDSTLILLIARDF
jgi:hypothetical protein